MLTLGSLSFLMPWLLGALVILPLLWRLLRVTPPRPQVVRFPAFFLLRGLAAVQKAPAKMPWWLIVLRCLIAACFIVALAEPVTRLLPQLPGGEGPVLLVVDNGWAAAANWDKRLARIDETLQPLARANRPVLLLPTAPAPDSAAPSVRGPMPAGEALQQVNSLQPQAWPSMHKQAGEAIAAAMQQYHPGYAVFFSDGTSRSALETQDMVAAMTQGKGQLLVVNDDKVNRPLMLRRVTDQPGQLRFDIERLAALPQDEPMSLIATAESGAVLDELRFVFPGGKKGYTLDWPLGDDLRVKVARVSLREPQMASTVFLTDAQWRQRPVGIIADTAQKDNASFLNEVYYLKRALETDSTLAVDDLPALLSQERAVIIWPDSAALPPADRARLQDWVEQGGFLIRFAGPALAAAPQDNLLPVALRAGQRAMEGAMTWEKPARLSPIADTSPFYGLDVPDDVTVTRQVLAAPEPETFSRSWLQLSDGTPLITGGAVGKGSIALIHTTAGPDWSNFCYSGLYVDVLRRMVALSRGVSDYKGQLTLSPVMVMDGYGRLQPPAAGALAGVIDPHADFDASPRTPPGLYGDRQQFRVYALGDALSGIYPLPKLSGNVDMGTYDLQGETAYKTPLLKQALLLLLADIAATLWLRGVITLPAFGRGLSALLLAAVLLLPQPALAQEAPDEAARASKIYFAYVETGDPAVDQVSRNGLTGLGHLLSGRTTIHVEGVVGVDPERDEVYSYPFLYWPMTQAQRPLSLSAAQNVQNYLSHGGMIVFDTRDLQFGDVEGETLGQRKLREVTKDLGMPALMPVEKGHILTKSFYLLDSFPGLYAGGQIWVEKDPNPNYDGVTSVIIGGNDWAGAWSEAAGDRARLAVTPGGEQQREMAYRVGVNIAMVALAGNYKADQVHVPFILERMGK